MRTEKTSGQLYKNYDYKIKNENISSLHFPQHHPQSMAVVWPHLLSPFLAAFPVWLLALVLSLYLWRATGDLTFNQYLMNTYVLPVITSGYLLCKLSYSYSRTSHISQSDFSRSRVYLCVRTSVFFPNEKKSLRVTRRTKEKY